MKLCAKFSVLVIVVGFTLISCYQQRRDYNSIPKTKLLYAECFLVINLEFGVACFQTTQAGSVFVIKRRINDWDHRKYRKLDKGESVQISLVRNQMIESHSLGIQSSQMFEYSIDGQTKHMFDFSSNGNVYDSPDIFITNDDETNVDEVYLRIE